MTALITDYTTLQAAVVDDSHRTDLASRVPRYIQQAENEIFRDLALRKIEAKATGTTSGDTLAIPASAVQIERVEIEANGRKYTLDYTSPNGIDQLTVSPGVPTRFTVENGVIRLLVAPAGAYTYSVFYVPSLAPLSDTSPTNWLVATFPDVYLYGALRQMALWAEDADMLAKYEPLFQAAKAAVQGFDDRQRFPASGGLQIKPRRYR